MKKTLAIVPFFVLTIISCKKEQNFSTAKGTIVKESVDGCIWLIKLDNNQLLEPTNLSSFSSVTIQDGQKVNLTYRQSKNTFSICMMGEMVTLLGISNR